MKNIRFSFLSLVAMATIILSTSCGGSSTPPRKTLVTIPSPVNIIFGNPANSCSGKGICSSSVGIRKANDSSTFVGCIYQPIDTTAPASPATIQLFFNLGMLEADQPGQASNFSSKLPVPYVFDTTFDVSQISPLFSGTITPTSPSTIQLQPSTNPTPATTIILTYTLTTTNPK